MLTLAEMRKRLPLLIILSGLGGGVLILLSALLLAPPARVVKVEPAAGARAVGLRPQGRIIFDRAVELRKLTLIINPPVEYAFSFGASTKEVNFSFGKDLAPGTTYSLRVGGEGVEEFGWAFETQKISAGGRGDPFAAEAFAEYKERFPLAGLMPVLTDDFKIVQLGEDTYKVTLYAADKEAAKEAVFSWFREHGVEPEELTIEWGK